MLLRLLLLMLAGAAFTTPQAPGGPAPHIAPNSYGLAVVARSAQYRQQISAQRDASLVDLAAFIPGLRLQLSYATPLNPTGRVLYDARRAYLRLPAALALRAAQRELARRHVGLLIYDAYRPYGATLALWKAVRDAAFAAPPWSGSRHNRGAAVDLSLVDLRTGRALPMPTAYDTFSPQAGHGYQALPAAVLRDRALLRRVMERHGFTALPEEWWHYDYAGWSRFPLLDLRLSAVAKVRPRADVWALYPPQVRLGFLLRALVETDSGSG
jgi:zinc D-Ala-D-Ala dipeptidase